VRIQAEKETSKFFPSIRFLGAKAAGLNGHSRATPEFLDVRFPDPCFGPSNAIMLMAS
jgi:hypothetical protein